MKNHIINISSWPNLGGPSTTRPNSTKFPS
jgi:hypothetical protein